MTVRRARADEVVDVRHRVLRAGQPRETAIFPGDDHPTTRHWVVEADGAIVGVVSVIVAEMPAPHPVAPPPALQLRGMAVLAERRGEHLGEALLLATHRDVGAPMWCNARQNVVDFYVRGGWQAIGAPFTIAPIGPHQRMWWPGA